MSVDIATLGIKVDASEVKRGDEALDKMAQTGAKTEASTKKVTKASAELSVEMLKLLAAVRDNTSALSATAQAEAKVNEETRKAAQAAREAAAARKQAGEEAKKVGMAEREAAEQMRATAQAEREVTASVDRLKASVQPFAAAQDRANAELAEARMLYEAGAISAREFANAQSVLSTRATLLGEKQERVNQMLMGGGKAAKLTANEALNLSRQFADVGVTAAMGMNPFMILIQQGPQIADIMRTSGLGIGGVFKELLKMVGILRVVESGTAATATASAAAATAQAAQAATATAATAATTALGVAGQASAAGAKAAAAGATQAAAANVAMGETATAAAAAEAVALAPLGVALAVIVAGLAVVTAGFAIFANETEKEVGKVTKGMNLTEKQLDRLKDKGTEVTVTWGDTMSAVFTVTGNRLKDAFDTPLTWLKDQFKTVYEYVRDGSLWAVKALVGTFYGAYYAIESIWKNLPSAIGDAVITTVNTTTSAIASMINSAVEGMNGLIEKLPTWLGGSKNAIGFRATSKALDNPYAGAAGKARDDAGAAFGKGMAAGGAAVDRFGDDVVTEARKNARKRVEKDAGDAEKAKTPKKSEAEKEYERQLKAAKDYLEGLKTETSEIGKNRIELKMASAERAAAKAPTDELKKSITEAADAWKTATIAEETSKLRRELADLNEQTGFETSQLKMNIQQRTVSTAQREIDLKLRALERDGIDISAASIQKETAAYLANANAKGKALLDAEQANAAADAVSRMNDNLQAATSSFANLFGTAGKGFGDLISTLGDYYEFQADQEAKLAEVRSRYGSESDEYLRAQMDAKQEATERELDNYGRLIGGVKSMFSERSAAYKVMEGVEKAYAAVRMAMAVKELLMETVLTSTKVGGAGARMASDAAETASSVAKSGIRAAADGVAAFAKTLASLPFPFNLAAGAAVVAALVAVGVKISGGGKKSASADMAASVDKASPVYSGPVDEYGAPTSSYSVLKPGRTTVANDNSGRVEMGQAAGMAGGVYQAGDVSLVVQGNLDSDVLPRVQEMLVQNREQTVQEARQAVAQDRAAANTRQRIGGS